VARARPWWSLDEAARRGQADPITDMAEADAEVERLLALAVRERMVADVPLGAFLSGGLDSSAVVALMQAQSARPVRTFTIGFDNVAFNEADAAALVARHLGTDHTELRLSPAEAQAAIPELADVWDEPFADESQLPTLLISRLARRHVTVALSGDGGDEVFGGYRRHVFARYAAPLLPLPWPVRQAGAGLLGALAFLHPDHRNALPKLTRTLTAPDEDALYGALTGVGGTWHASDPAGTPGLATLADRIMLRDIRRYLPGDILVKLDRASMAVGLEARSPLLDHRLLEFAWRLPVQSKITHGRGKWPLRRLLRRHVPAEILARPKHGFNVPVGAWLRGPLRPWAEDLMAEPRLRRHGLLDPLATRRCLLRHITGEPGQDYRLWAILMVQAWLESARGPRQLAAQRPVLPSLPQVDLVT
jgi:asparagine synthase (glutamine-hydrolysing)